MTNVYMVTKHGERKTSKIFYNLGDAREYYDRLCKNNPKGYAIHLEEIVGMDATRRYVMVYRNHKDYGTKYVEYGTYRNVADSKKRKPKTNEFGLDLNLR